MTRRIAVVVVLLGCAISAFAAPRRATWVWDNAVTEKAKQAELLRFCRDRRIDTLFLHAPATHLQERADEFRSLVAAAHAQRMRVEALDGRPGWATDHDKAKQFVGAVVTFNQAGAPDERFDGVHLDVEPYGTEEWGTARSEIALRWLGMFDEARAAAAGLPVTADIPLWLGGVAAGNEDLQSAILARVDTVALMAYATQHNKKRLAAACRSAIREAQRQGRSVWIAISVQPAYLVGTGKRQHAEKLVKTVERTLVDAPTVAGVAIHDYEHWQPLYAGRR